MKDATAEARQNAEHDRRIFQLLNRHPLNQSAETIIEARFKDPPIDTGLHFIRLLACVAVAEGLMESDPVLCDIYELSQMDAYDALFKNYKDKASDEEYEYLRLTVLKDWATYKVWYNKLKKIPEDKLKSIETVSQLIQELDAVE